MLCCATGCVAGTRPSPAAPLRRRRAAAGGCLQCTPSTLTLRGSKTPAALSTSTQMGTVELTGLEMMVMMALGQYLATPVQSVLTMPALMLKRSSRVMPGLRGTPAGMMTTSQPVSAAASCSSPA